MHDKAKEGPLLAAIAVKVQQPETRPLLDFGLADSEKVGNACAAPEAKRELSRRSGFLPGDRVSPRAPVERGDIDRGANGGHVARHDGLLECLGERPGFGVAGRFAG